MRLLITIILLCVGFLNAQQVKTITFPSGDSLLITADYYKVHPAKTPLIILFHQAGWSRGEYRETAPWLNSLGYNCLAVDQRSGEAVNNVSNLTAKRAKLAGKATTYLDALPDMRAALLFARDSLKAKSVAIWGSSYSASLSLVLAADYQDDLAAVLSFSPGEYFARAGKGTDYILKHATKLTLPVFITSAGREYKEWKNIFNAIPAPEKNYFLPDDGGQHGSRALWSTFPQHEKYRDAVKEFLSKNLPAKPEN